jgi:hypothetical protein
MYVKEMIQVKVYVYNRRRGVREYVFLINSRYESHVRRRGRKRVNIVQLFKRIRPKLRKINPDDKFLMPDEEYSFNLPLPYGRLGNTDLGICVER